MAISSVNNTSGAATTSTTDTSAVSSAAATNGLGPDDFMKLLVAQLKNQDPNNPLDTKELVTQLSQLTSVQELQTIGTKMGALTTATNSMAANQSSGLIGKTVTGTADSANLGATGGATSAVTLAQSADTATVSVSNAAGRVVRTFSLPSTTAGRQVFTWDGKTTTGERAPQGTYTFSVEAKDKSGTLVATDQSITGLVTGVDYDGGTPSLQIGDATVPLSNVTTISQ